MPDPAAPTTPVELRPLPAPVRPPATHEVVNQVPPLVGYDVFAADPVLVDAAVRYGAGWARDDLSALGRLAGSAEAQRWGVEANEAPPQLRTHDRTGHRVDEIVFHPSWHRLMEVAIGSGLAAAPWASARPGAHVARAAGFVVWSQVEAGHGCPVSMTYAAVPALHADPALAAAFVPGLASQRYDPRPLPVAAKAGATAGMAMTEKQGGSDVRANTTVATSLADGCYALTGHKWFCSAPQSDLFLVLAHAPGGLTCFVLPRELPDGSRNAVRVMRLKDKLGNRSNASSEIELDGAVVWRLGEEGRGVRTIVEMVNATRLDCVLGTAALMRQAVVQAVHHATHRHAFGRALVDQPLMQNVLADLVAESEAASLVGMRLAAAADAGADPQEQAFRRLALAASKFWICKRGPTLAAEALECLGGNGYVEDSGLPRLYREAPLLSVWEGSGNVNALDVLRVVTRQPDSVEAFLAEVEPSAAGHPALAGHVDGLRFLLARPDAWSARVVAQRVAQVLQASLAVRHSPPAVADAVVARLDAPAATFGTLPRRIDAPAVIGRAAVPV